MILRQDEMWRKIGPKYDALEAEDRRLWALQYSSRTELFRIKIEIAWRKKFEVEEWKAHEKVWKPYFQSLGYYEPRRREWWH